MRHWLLLTVSESLSLLSFQRWKKLPDELQHAMIATVSNLHLNCLAHSFHECTLRILIKRVAAFRIERYVCRMSSCAFQSFAFVFVFARSPCHTFTVLRLACLLSSALHIHIHSACINSIHCDWTLDSSRGPPFSFLESRSSLSFQRWIELQAKLKARHESSNPQSSLELPCS